jgi:hypothetical protein
MLVHNTKFEIRRASGGHVVHCFQREIVKVGFHKKKRAKWVEKDARRFYGEGSRNDAREYGRQFVRECE